MQTSLFQLEPQNQSHSVSEDKKSQSIKQSLDELFPEQQIEEKNFKKSKEILGILSDEFTPDELKDVITKVQYLCENWLDAFERNIFGEKTLQELLHEKGGV